MDVGIGFWFGDCWCFVYVFGLMLVVAFFFNVFARCIGMCVFIWVCLLGSSIYVWLIDVMVVFGVIVFTWMFCAAYLSVRVWVRFCMLFLDIE